MTLDSFCISETSTSLHNRIVVVVVVVVVEN